MAENKCMTSHNTSRREMRNNMINKDTLIFHNQYTNFIFWVKRGVKFTQQAVIFFKSKLEQSEIRFREKASALPVSRLH